VPAEVPKKGPPVAIIGAVLVLIALLGGGAFLFLKPSGSLPAQPAVASQPATPPLAPAPPPPMTQAERESTLTATLGALPCSFLSGRDSAAKAMISGIAGVGEPQAALGGALASLPAGSNTTSNVQTIEGPYCDALDAIRPYHNLFTPAAMQLGLNLAGGKTTLHAGDLVTITNKLPAFSGYLETDYFSADGTVYHAYQADPKAKPEPAGDTKTTPLGTVAAPFGTDMILSIASSAPLFTKTRAAVESASDYLPDLRTAMQNVATDGGNVAVAAIPVVTEPK
jgi:serine/threonine-protein kinase